MREQVTVRPHTSASGEQLYKIKKPGYQHAMILDREQLDQLRQELDSID